MKYRSNHIMALVPKGEDGIKILKQAHFFQQSLGMKIFLYRIIENLSVFTKIFYSKRIKKLRSDELNELRNFTGQVIPRDVLPQFTFRAEAGKKLPVLLRQSKRGGYEFMIIGKNGGNNNLEPNELDKLISLSSIPVMTVSLQHLVTSVKTIVIPVDVLQTTQKKLRWATYFAKKFNAKIIIVSALSINIERKTSLAWKNSEKLKHMLIQRGIHCETFILQATDTEKHKVITEFIEKQKADMVIIRTHQDSFAKDIQIGKFVSNVVHGSKVPVFTVNRFLQPLPEDFEI